MHMTKQIWEDLMSFHECHRDPRWYDPLDTTPAMPGLGPTPPHVLGSPPRSVTDPWEPPYRVPAAWVPKPLEPAPEPPKRNPPEYKVLRSSSPQNIEYQINRLVREGWGVRDWSTPSNRHGDVQYIVLMVRFRHQ